MALPTSLGGSHTGVCYTLETRVERGFGEKIYCGRNGCKHTATNHAVNEFPHPCYECECIEWVEPPDVADDDPGLGDQPEKVSGMGPDSPVIENSNGAKQSSIPAVFTTMPLHALWELAKLQKYGDDKYGPGNWRGIAENDHIDHAFAHLMADRLGDVSDDHLLHATWRLMAALETRLFNNRMDRIASQEGE